MEYVQLREDRTSITGYGVAIHKHDLFAEGGLPVIYGLEGYPEIDIPAEDALAGCRVIDPDYLPLAEQYRLLRFNPNPRTRHPIDWSHEREWRWSLRLPEYRGFNLGLSLTSNSDRKPSEGRVHLLVERDEDVPWLREEVIANIPRPAEGDLFKKAWMKKLNEGVKIISLEAVERQLADGDLRFGKVDTILDLI
ncbi:MAG: hypothetical protein A2X58_12000 [Nitrospirae bacterium GWC2_56_14]|nr:MAG: hypothetical protein A2X58_12000 [Nitrospirae bacterium GWC2_56_14]